jgi:hypothetical protein
MDKMPLRTQNNMKRGSEFQFTAYARGFLDDE